MENCKPLRLDGRTGNEKMTKEKRYCEDCKKKKEVKSYINYGRERIYLCDDCINKRFGAVK